MTKQEYIKKAREILTFKGYGDFEGTEVTIEDDKLEALYNLHLEGVREIIGEDEKTTKIDFDDYNLTFQLNLRTLQRNELKAEQREKLKEQVL